MTGFEILTIDKTDIMMKIVSNKELCKAIFYNEPSFKNQPDIAPQKLFYNNIYPFRFIPDLNEEQKTFITLSFKDFKYVNNIFMGGKIYFNVFTHQNLFRTDYGALRTDYILTQIHNIFNQTRGTWMGKLEFFHMDELHVNAKFSGNYIGYRIVDFQ